LQVVKNPDGFTVAYDTDAVALTIWASDPLILAGVPAIDSRINDGAAV
jgi:hypothetical protein